MKKEPPSKEILYQKYIIENKSMKQVAKELNFTIGSIWKYLHQYDIPTRQIGKAIHPWYETITKEEWDKRIQKGVETKRKKYDSGELAPWNKNLTKETDERVKKQSETQKLTHKDFSGENNPFYGKKHSEEFRKRQSLNKGGTGIPYENREYPAEWTEKLRESIRQRDNHICQYCGMTEEEHRDIYERKLDVHHIDYIKKNCDPKNLISLCFQCHKRTLYHRPYWISFFTQLLATKILSK